MSVLPPALFATGALILPATPMLPRRLQRMLEPAAPPTSSACRTQASMPAFDTAALPSGPPSRSRLGQPPGVLELAFCVVSSSWSDAEFSATTPMKLSCAGSQLHRPAGRCRRGATLPNPSAAEASPRLVIRRLLDSYRQSRGARASALMVAAIAGASVGLPFNLVAIRWLGASGMARSPPLRR